tara:strand:- start:91 stop:654 length:564 start_codon:yes stop_codon:yes gene_type:complete
MNNLSTDLNKKKEELLKLLQKNSYKKGDFKLSSGKQSNHYLNCKPVSLNGYGLSLISDLFLELKDVNSTAVAGLTLGADPLVSGVIVTAAIKGVFLDALIIRKEIKGYGTNVGIEGPVLNKYSEISVLEDVVTTAGSCLKAVNKLREQSYIVKEVLTIVDRNEGGGEILKKNKIQLKSLFTIKDFIN